VPEAQVLVTQGFSGNGESEMPEFQTVDLPDFQTIV
jgi:hypothetical protein